MAPTPLHLLFGIGYTPNLAVLIDRDYPEEMMLDPVIDNGQCEAGPTFADGASGRIK